MEKFNFYIGFTNDNKSYRKEIIFPNIEIDNFKKAKKLLKAIKEILSYLGKEKNL